MAHYSGERSALLIPPGSTVPYPPPWPPQGSVGGPSWGPGEDGGRGGPLPELRRAAPARGGRGVGGADSYLVEALLQDVQ